MTRVSILAVITLLLGTAAAADDRTKLAEAYLNCNIHASLQLSSGIGDPGTLADEALARCEDESNRLAGILDRRLLLQLRAIVRDANVAAIGRARIGLVGSIFDGTTAPPLRCASCGKTIDGLAAGPPVAP